MPRFDFVIRALHTQAWIVGFASIPDNTGGAIAGVRPC